MSQPSQWTERLENEQKELALLTEESSIFRFVSLGSDAPHHYEFFFRGRTWLPPEMSPAWLNEMGEHRCSVFLTQRYPELPPAVRWLSPLWHPNVAADGDVYLEQIGLPWSPVANLVALAECLWNVLRFDFLNDQTIANPAAWEALKKERSNDWPTDRRLLRDRPGLTNRNIVKYRRKTKGVDDEPRELFYIRDSSPGLDHIPLQEGEIVFLDRPKPEHR